jgi:hypothetical protein
VIELTLRPFGKKWRFGWPYKLTTRGYELPDAEHETLVAWWRRSYIDRVEGHRTRAAALEALDLAVRREPPPVPFQVRRLDEIIRTYPATAIGRAA